MQEMDLMLLSTFSVAPMAVPGASGRKTFLTLISMLPERAGSMVMGWTTFAPKYASSAASS